MAQTKKRLSTPAKAHDPAQIAEAIDYKLQGHGYEEIAEQMKIQPQLARDLVTAGLIALIRDEPLHRLMIDLQRIDQMLTAVYPTASAGDIHAIQSVINLRQQREEIEKKYQRMESFRRLAPPAEENPP